MGTPIFTSIVGTATKDLVDASVDAITTLFEEAEGDLVWDRSIRLKGGNDTVFRSSLGNNDVSLLGVNLSGNVHLHGGNGRDTVNYRDATAGLSISLAPVDHGFGVDAPWNGNADMAGVVSYLSAADGDAVDLLTGIENATGTAFDDVLTGSNAANVLRGLAGDDVILGLGGRDNLLGGGGSDEVDGGAGNDRIGGGAGADLLAGGQGDDTILGGSGGDKLSGGAGADLLKGGSDTDMLLGDGGADRILGQQGDDAINGGLGADDLFGGDGNDLIFGGADEDHVVGGSGNDSLAGEAGADALFGGAGDDGLYGGSGADALAGGDGEDILRGGAGSDDLAGGLGPDAFVWTQADLGESLDRVLDFEIGADRVDLSAVLPAQYDSVFDHLLIVGVEDGHSVLKLKSDGDTINIARFDNITKAEMWEALDSGALFTGEVVIDLGF